MADQPASVVSLRRRIEPVARGSVSMPPEPGFVPTEANEQISAALTAAQAGSTITRVTASAGIGKTEAARRYAAKNSDVWLVTFQPSSATLTAALRAIYAGVAGWQYSGGHARDLAEHLMERIAGRGGLLIIDEAQFLHFDAAEELRALWDRTHDFGLCLMGAYVKYDPIKARSPQLTSRTAMSVFLPRLSERDVQALLRAWQIAGAAEREYLGKIAAGPGAMRAFLSVMRSARLLAANEKAPLALKHFQEARAALRDA